jgi:1-acyl-sn-glycerol-3-phosphate acyltransferase
MKAAMTALRALWRLACSVGHALLGGAICAFLFPFLDTASRMRHVQAWSRRMLGAMGIRLAVEGRWPDAPVLLLANHVSWLDILAIDAARPVRFVSKADVRRWPLLGFMVAAGGTLFIERERKRDALRVVHQVAEALRGGATVAVFPEGTTGTGPQLLPLHANLLQAAIATGAPLLPVALRYADPSAPFSPAVEFIGATTLIESMWRVASAERLVIHLRLLPTLASVDADRRTLAEAVRGSIQGALDSASFVSV